MIYLDYAATSWPKPKEVFAAMSDFMENAGGNPGRSGHRLSINAARIVFRAREAVAELFNVSDPLKIIFLPNVTYALNLAIRGLLKPGERAITTGMEHNSVMRPLRELERAGVQLQVVPCHPDGSLDMPAMQTAITPGVRLVVLTHASNVVGTIMPVSEVAQLAHEVGAYVLLDTAQTAGVVPIDQQAMGVDLLAFTGHKGLYGPTGTGGLILGERLDLSALDPLVRGGTGSKSEFEEQPEILPDKYESGTPNSVGIAGLGAGVRWVLSQGVASIGEQEAELRDALMAGLMDISGITVYGPNSHSAATAVVSCRVAGTRVSDIGFRLDEEYGVLSRVGLHCAPAAHKSLGTFPEGTIRLAPGFHTSLADIQDVLQAMKKLAAQNE